MSYEEDKYGSPGDYSDGERQQEQTYKVSEHLIVEDITSQMGVIGTNSIADKTTEALEGHNLRRTENPE